MDSPDEELNAKDFIIKIQNWLKYLRLKCFIIITMSCLGALFGVFYSLIKVPNYIAELNFVVDEDKSSGGSFAAGLASQFGFDIGSSGGGVFTGDNLLELLKSRAVIEKTLLTTIIYKNKISTLAEIYINYNGLRKRWRSDTSLNNLHYFPNVNRNKFTLKQDSILGVIQKQIIKKVLSVDKIDKKASIISLKVISENEMFSKSFSENLIKIVSDFYIETKTKKQMQNVLILQHQTDSIRRQLNVAISGVALSIDLNPNPNSSLQILRTPSQRKQVDVQANTAILTELVKNLEISKITLRKETPLIQVIDSPILPLEKTKIGILYGLIFGFFIAGFVSVLFLTSFLFYKKIMSS